MLFKNLIKEEKMKTNDENKNEGAFKPKKNRRWMIHAIYLAILIAILLLWKCCSGKTEKEHQANMISLMVPLTQENDSLKSRINQLENQKAVLVVTNTVKNHSSGKFVEAIIVSSDDPRESSLFIEDVIKRVPFKVLVSVECPPVPKCPELPIAKDSCIEKVCLDSLTKDSIEVCLDKQYRTDSSRILMLKKLALKDFILDNPSVNYPHTYTEYLPNPYRQKADKAFKNAMISGGSAVVLYGLTELAGHAKFWDDRDNSDAQLKSNLIVGTRVVVTGLAAYSFFKFQRVIHFHKMETKLIVHPTTIGLTLRLDKSVGK